MANNIIITADKLSLREGDTAFNYYDMQLGVIGKIDSHPQPDTMKGQTCSTPMEDWDNYWFEFIQETNITSLDGSRICSVEFARSKGWM